MLLKNINNHIVIYFLRISLVFVHNSVPFLPSFPPGNFNAVSIRHGPYWNARIHSGTSTSLLSSTLLQEDGKSEYYQRPHPQAAQGAIRKKMWILLDWLGQEEEGGSYWRCAIWERTITVLEMNLLYSCLSSF